MLKKNYIITLFCLAGWFCSCENTTDLNTEYLISIEKRIKKSGGIEAVSLVKDTVNWIGRWKNEGKREQFLKDVVREINFSNPDLQVNLKFPDEIEEYEQTTVEEGEIKDAKFIANMIQTNHYTWDIVMMESQTVFGGVSRELNMPHWGHEYLVNFKDMPGYKETQNPDVYENSIIREPFDDIHLGTYIEGAYLVVFYNQDLAEKMGLQIKQFDMTADDFIHTVKQIYNYNQANSTNYAAICENSDWITMPYVFDHLLKSAVGYSTDYQIPETFSQQHQDALYQCLKIMEELGKYAPLIDTQKNTSWWDGRKLVLEDKAVFYINGTWMYNIWEDIDKEKTLKMVPCEMPVIKKMDYYSGEFKANFAVLKKSPRVKNAIKAMLAFADEDFAMDWIRTTRCPTGIKMQFSEFGTGGDVYDVFLGTMIHKYKKNIGITNFKIFGSQHGEQSVPPEDIVALLSGATTADELMKKYLSMYGNQ